MDAGDALEAMRKITSQAVEIDRLTVELGRIKRERDELLRLVDDATGRVDMDWCDQGADLIAYVDVLTAKGKSDD